MDPEKPNRSSNMEKAEGDRETVGNVDTPRKSEWGEGTSEGGGVINRPIGEEVEDQKDVPERGQEKNERGEEKNDALGDNDV